ncbi:hypothetical protein FYK55_26800 [Roseiconus nitratireducens]|uniref:Uncharacterized protein n=1 Tax=Roseiconus nitratireducens TaxID=2605748 RepID=A0A5M6CU14_9BACT|nr:hypothetical protein [Roseiconus nitratireducens]KAA5538724.1 hypothetical protein FYK55_26800 [Roseiconus nitratireducens]
MSNRPRPRAYFYRNGIELTGHKMNGRCVEHFGVPTGKIRSAVCFSSITVRTTRDEMLTEADFDGPVSVKVWSPEQPAAWFGIASVDTVERINAEA